MTEYRHGNCLRKSNSVAQKRHLFICKEQNKVNGFRLDMQSISQSNYDENSNRLFFCSIYRSICFTHTIIQNSIFDTAGSVT